LRKQRKRQGLSAGELGKLVGVTQLSIYNWERGVARPRGARLAALAAVRKMPKREIRARLEQLAGPKVARRRKGKKFARR
jgi:transcriptional regulator with XRE-family HTH domain